MTAAESKATYNEIRDYVWEHHQLKVSNLYIAQVKEKCGIKREKIITSLNPIIIANPDVLRKKKQQFEMH